MTPRRPDAALLAVLGGIVLLGVVAGTVWAMVTPTITGVVVAGGVRYATQNDVTQGPAAVMVFGIVMAFYGVAATLVAWFAARAWRGPIGFLAVLAATVGGSAAAVEVGGEMAKVRLGDPDSAHIGDVVRVVPDLWLRGHTTSGDAASWIMLICAPFTATLIYLICVLASRTSDLGVGDLGTDAPEYGQAPQYSQAPEYGPGTPVPPVDPGESTMPPR